MCHLRKIWCFRHAGIGPINTSSQRSSFIMSYRRRIYSICLFCVGMMLAPVTQIAQVSSSAPAAAQFSSPDSRPYTGTSALMTDPADGLEAVGGMMAFFNPSLRYGYQYGDGIPSSPGRQVKTSVHRLSASMAIRLAERFIFTYSPSRVWYSSDVLEDSTDHYVDLSASGMTGDWRIGFRQIYSDTASPLLETGRQTRQKLWGTDASVGIPIGPRTNLEIGLGQNLRSTQDFTNINTWSGSVWLLRRLGSKLNAGLGVSSSFSSINPGRDLFSQQMSGRVDWKPGSKLSLGFSGGVGVSRFRDSERGSIVNPIFSGNARYQILETTDIIFTANRSTGVSYFRDRLRETTQFNVGLTQRLFGHFSLNLSVARSNEDYISALFNDGSADREDRYWFYYAALSTRFLQDLSLSLSWQHRKSDSNVLDFDYGSSIVGFSLGWKY